jgi:hypothetical protein
MQYLLLLCTKSLNPKRYKSQERGRSFQISKKSSLQGLLHEGFFANIAARRTLCKDCCKRGFFANLLQGLPSLWMQAKNQSQHHAGKSNSALLWYKNTDTDTDTEREIQRKTE